MCHLGALSFIHHHFLLALTHVSPSSINFQMTITAPFISSSSCIHNSQLKPHTPQYHHIIHPPPHLLPHFRSTLPTITASLLSQIAPILPPHPRATSTPTCTVSAFSHTTSPKPRHYALIQIFHSTLSSSTFAFPQCFSALTTYRTEIPHTLVPLLGTSVTVNLRPSIYTPTTSTLLLLLRPRHRGRPSLLATSPPPVPPRANRPLRPLPTFLPTQPCTHLNCASAASLPHRPSRVRFYSLQPPFCCT